MMIIATVPTSPFDPDKLKKMMLAGADIMRFNFNYESLTENLRRLEIFNELNEEFRSTIKSLVDLPGNRIRFGRFNPKNISVEEGGEYIFKSSDYSDNPLLYIPIMTDRLGSKVAVGQTIPINDGEIMIEVVEIINEETIKIKTLNNGTFSIFRGFYLQAPINYEETKKKYIDIIEKIEGTNPDYIAIPYMPINEYNEILKIVDKNNKRKIMIKLEDGECINNQDTIFSKYKFDAAIIDRGELGVNLPFEKLGLIQKQLIKTANKYKKTVIVSTQIIESVSNTFIPARSDIADLTNIVLDGANGIMLCRETAIGPRPTYAINCAKKIINEAIKELNK